MVGAGFAGLKAAKVLANHGNLRVILVDHRNHHLFQPLLYQVATAGLNPSDIAVPIRVQFRGAPNVEIHLGHVDGVDLSRQIVFGAGGTRSPSITCSSRAAPVTATSAIPSGKSSPPG